MNLEKKNFKFADCVFNVQEGQITGPFDDSLLKFTDQKEIPHPFSAEITPLLKNASSFLQSSMAKSPAQKKLHPVPHPSAIKNSSFFDPLKLIEKQALQEKRDDISFLKHFDSVQAPLGLLLWIKEGNQKNIQINYNLSEKSPSRATNFFILEKDSSLNLVENFLTDASLRPVFVENYIYAKESAQIFSLHIQNKILSKKSTAEKAPLHNQSFVFCQLEDSARFFSLDVNLSSFSKKIYIHSRKPRAVSLNRGINLLTDTQKADHFIYNQKDGEGSYSRQFYRNVLSGRSKSLVHSKVAVYAQNSDSKQTIQNLLLSPHAKAKNRPELIIAKDQVQASHGATTSKPNPNEIFYLNTRGLSHKKALDFLVKGWVQQIFKNKEEENEYFSKPIQTFQEKIQQDLKTLVNGHIKNILSH